MVQDDIHRPRHAPRQLLRENHTVGTTEGFFKVSVAIPFLDNLGSSLHRDGLLLVPANIVEHYPNGCISAPEGIKCLATLWEEDLENINLVEAEFIRWCDKWNRENAKENPVVLSSMTAAIKECKVASFPNLHKLLRLVLTYANHNSRV